MAQTEQAVNGGIGEVALRICVRASALDSVKDSTCGPAPGFIIGGPNPLSYSDFNTGWPLNSWPITENSNGYQTSYIRLLARYVQ